MGDAMRVHMKRDRTRRSGHRQALNAQDYDQSAAHAMTQPERDAQWLRAMAKQLHACGFTVPQVRRHNRRAGVYLSAAIDLLQLAADELDGGHA